MNTEDKKPKDILNIAIQGTDTELVNQKSDLRKYMNTTILTELLKRWRASTNEELRSSLFQIFADIKEQEALPFVLESIEQEENIERKNELISILWMSSIDASENLVDLVNMALEGNYMTVVEISTVIESFDSEFGEDEVMESMYQIDEKLLDVQDPELSTMLVDLKEVINKLNVT